MRTKNINPHIAHRTYHILIQCAFNRLVQRKTFYSEIISKNVIIEIQKIRIVSSTQCVSGVSFVRSLNRRFCFTFDFECISHEYVIDGLHHIQLLNRRNSFDFRFEIHFRSIVGWRSENLEKNYIIICERSMAIDLQHEEMNKNFLEFSGSNALHADNNIFPINR